jgi:VanZ family protein
MSVGWLSLIWLVSSIPSDDLPGIKIVSADKLAHIAVYLVLGLLVNNWIKEMRLGRIRINLIYAILILLAGLDEQHQELIRGRTVSVYDLLANCSGIALAYLGTLRNDRVSRSKR